MKNEHLPRTSRTQCVVWKILVRDHLYAQARRRMIRAIQRETNDGHDDDNAWCELFHYQKCRVWSYVFFFSSFRRSSLLDAADTINRHTTLYNHTLACCLRVITAAAVFRIPCDAGNGRRFENRRARTVVVGFSRFSRRRARDSRITIWCYCYNITWTFLYCPVAYR